MQHDGCQAPVWKAGEVVPAGTYVRIDDESYRKVTLQQTGPLPASFDGHVAYYRAAARFLDEHSQQASHSKSNQNVLLSHAQ